MVLVKCPHCGESDRVFVDIDDEDDSVQFTCYDCDTRFRPNNAKFTEES